MTIESLRAPIEAALEYAGGSHTYEDITKAVAEGRMQFWAGPRSAVVTEVVQYPQYKALQFFLAGGDLKELEAMAEGIEEWGRQQGCTRVVFTGRKGWERTFLVRRGYDARSADDSGCYCYQYTLSASHRTR